MDGTLILIRVATSPVTVLHFCKFEDGIVLVHFVVGDTTASIARLLGLYYDWMAVLH